MEELEKLISRLHERGVGSVEDRATTRAARPGALMIRIAESEGSSRSITVQFRDGSAGGMGFTARQPLKALTRFSVMVRHPRDGNIVLRYEVVRCDQIRKDLYEIGAKLIR